MTNKVDQKLAAIDAERKQIARRLEELDDQERDVLGLVPRRAPRLPQETTSE